MDETTQTRLKRLRMRAWHRGTKEMDIILGHFADDRLDALSPDDVELFDALLAENDHDLYQWVTRQMTPPARYAAMIDTVATHAHARLVAGPNPAI
ncbi:antitoxin CptB [Rhodovulum iodosum]|uniref:FAD assembly factor SdhE n=1 Tax=Rhodovulum iodosum TaxID=68291 RepID=A0ABV3XS22_9RHOB|nr:succinate dehydrogenase assembly factor 2 [Rhodovulum robiginosum]RSK31466.1 succinate dehydrogenase assembly factor 2 [Rhodovulum robiginosum]